jgi:NAD-dependent dihydropyrimidine dehydrogenase PreA subunit
MRHVIKRTGQQSPEPKGVSMKRARKVISIDEDKCTGCGDCIPNCPEGALQVIDGKARLISDLFCDGLGACVGHCPTGAMTVEEREAEPYDEARVMENVVKQGANTIAAHLAHLKEHGAVKYYREAVKYLKTHDVPVPAPKEERLACGCPGSQVQEMKPRAERTPPAGESRPSELRNWPVQITLVPVSAPYLKNADLLLAADCAPFAFSSFHDEFLPGKVLLVGCPKLDDASFYLEKLTEMFKVNKPNSVTCVHMEVPCCLGLVQIARQAIAASGWTIPFAETTISIRGEIK